MAVLSFIFSSAAKHNVDSESLSSELQQLGLPKGQSAEGCLVTETGWEQYIIVSQSQSSGIVSLIPG